MRRRPFHLFLAASLFLYFPMSIGFQFLQGSMFGFQHPPGQQEPLTLVDLLLSGVIPFFLIWGLIRVTKIGWYTLVAMVSLWGMKDLWSYYQESGATTSYLIHVGIYIVSITYFINPRVRHVYFDPKLRWWRAKKRFETNLPFMFSHDGTWYYPVLRNISEGGCFVETPHLAKVHEAVQITIPLPIPLGVSVIKAKGEVRWISRNPLRFGMGIQFKEPLPQHTKALKEFVRLQL